MNIELVLVILLLSWNFVLLNFFYLLNKQQRSKRKKIIIIKLKEKLMTFLSFSGRFLAENTNSFGRYI